ncbi:helix-turn-helix domain-containing protein [Cohnella fermenti]|uniref:AraC family transcriptional regulator n=1 Tax=Cohnella fermenti TaxID=2565925 RepID=A0A4S4BNN9_9BACL|nr:helix-turn-helix domain-containing protein [Cohnella fermenti]THF74148.1 AraC family transcriptional regulator [Cohnella fermenti]
MRSKRYKDMLKSSAAEYLYYFLGLSIIVASLLGGSLYYYSSSLLRQEAKTNAGNSLVLLRNAQELILSEVDKSMGNIFLDSFYASYMDYYYRQDMVTLRNLQAKLDNVLSTNDYIDSVYIYYHQDDFVLSSSQGPVRIEDFADRAFAEQLVTLPLQKNDARTRSVPGGLSGDETVITIVKAIPIFYTTKLPAAYVVVNLKGFYLQQVLDAIKTNPDAAIMVADESGHIITQKTGAASVRSASAYMAFPPPQAAGTYERIIDGSDTLVSYVTSEKYGWTYIYTIPMAVVTEKIRLWLKTALLVGLLVILVSLLCSLLFSRRMAAPLKRLLSMLRNDEDGPRRGKDVMQIERGVSRILDQNRRLGLLLAEYEAYSRNKFLADLLTSGEEEDPRTADKLAYYGLELPLDGRYAACLLSMDEYARYSAEHSERARNALFLQLMETMAEGTAQEHLAFIVEVDENRIALALRFAAEMPAEEAGAAVYAVAKAVHRLLGERHPHSFTLGAGTPHTGIGRLRESCYEAGVAVDSRLLLGNGSVIRYESIERGDRHIAYPMAIERHLLAALKMGDAEAVGRHLDEFEAYIQRHAPDRPEMVRSYYLQLFSSTLKCAYEMDAEFEPGSLLRETAHAELLGAETMRGMTAYMRGVYDRILLHQESKRSRKNKELIDAVQRYVVAQLHDDLSLERLGEQFYISASHLRKIFKDETGGTVKDFILRARMERAIELLGGTELRIADIAGQVGYLSAQSFSKAFRLETGKSPAAYREELLRAGTEPTE